MCNFKLRMGVRADGAGCASAGVPPGGLAEAAAAVPAPDGTPPGGRAAAGSAAAAAAKAVEPLRHGQQNQNLI